MTNSVDLDPIQNRNFLDSKLKFDPGREIAGAMAYTIFSVLLFVCYLHVYIAALVFLMYIFSRYTVSKTPKMVVLRSFSDDKVDLFLRICLGGFGLLLRPIWLNDADLNSQIVRSKIAGASVYVMRPIAWAVIAFTLIGVEKGNAPYEIAWVVWIVIGSTIFHGYQAGQSASYWLSFLISTILTLTSRHILQLKIFHSPESAWWDVAQISAYFLLIFAIATLVLNKSNLMRHVFSIFYFRDHIRSNSDLAKYKKDIRENSIISRYLPTAPVGVIEIQCSNALWRDVVRLSINNCSILLVDLTNILPGSSLEWELSEAYRAKIPIFFTCESSTLAQARLVIDRIGFRDNDIFVWYLSNKGRYGHRGIQYDDKTMSEMFVDYIKTIRKERPQKSNI